MNLWLSSEDLFLSCKETILSVDWSFVSFNIMLSVVICTLDFSFSLTIKVDNIMTNECIHGKA